MKASRWSCWATIGLAFAWVYPGAAQPTFVEVTPPNDTLLVTPATDDFWISSVAPADVDLDGDLDLAILGYYVVYFGDVEHLLVIFKNDGPDADGNWQFTHQEVPLGDLFAGASDLAWGDVDGDGDHDLAVGSEGATVIYQNTGGALAPLPTANPLPGYWEDSSYSNAYDLRSLAWGDYDGDGDQDLLIPSVPDFDLFEYSTRLMRNDGPDGTGGWLFADAAAGFAATVHAQSGWADDDADGDLDLLLVNVDPNTETGFVNRYENVAGAFVESSLLDIRVQWGLADWGDADADGDFDLLVAGNIEEADQTFDTVLRIYRNDAGTYVPETLIEAPINSDWLDIHAATWADYDSDGDVDLLLTGNFVGDGEIVGHSRIFTNEGGVYTELALELPAPVDSINSGGAFTWLDIDGDGDLDFFVAGAYFVPGGNGLVQAEAHLFRNGEATPNAAPGAPSALAATPAPGGVALSWQGASDEETPGAALTYELVLQPAGMPPAAARRLPEPGNLGPTTQFLLRNLEPGFYSWSVRAVDSAFEGGTVVAGSFAFPDTLIFVDGFESASTDAWSPGVP